MSLSYSQLLSFVNFVVNTNTENSSMCVEDEHQTLDVALPVAKVKFGESMTVGINYFNVTYLRVILP